MGIGPALMRISMETIAVTFPDGRRADIDPRGDGSSRVLIGTAERCQIRLAGTDLLPVHAYLAGRGNHYWLYLAPGAKCICNGRELSHAGDGPASGEPDLDRFEQQAARDRFRIEVGGAVIVFHRAKA